MRCGVEKVKMTGVKFFSLLVLAVLLVKGECLTRNCERISLDLHQDAHLDKEFISHVFHNFVTLNPAQCFMRCIGNCRCLSINYKVKSDAKFCELNEGSHFTNSSSLINSSGFVYYTLRRKYVSKVVYFNSYLHSNLGDKIKKKIDDLANFITLIIFVLNNFRFSWGKR